MRKRYELRIRPNETAHRANPVGAARMADQLASGPPIDRFWTRRGAEAAVRRLSPSFFGVLTEPYIEEIR